MFLQVEKTDNEIADGVEHVSFYPSDIRLLKDEKACLESAKISYSRLKVTSIESSLSEIDLRIRVCFIQEGVARLNDLWFIRLPEPTGPTHL